MAESAVVPSPDPVRLAVPKAFVILRAGHSPSPELARDIFAGDLDDTALLRIGAIQQANGDTKAAEATLGKVVKSYPQSTAAKLAQKRLEAIRAGQR